MTDTLRLGEPEVEREFGFRTTSPCGNYAIESWREGGVAVVAAKELRPPYRHCEVRTALEVGDPFAAGRAAVLEAARHIISWKTGSGDDA